MVTRTTNLIARLSTAKQTRLGVIHGPDMGTIIDLPNAGVVVGASPACDVVLTDRAISARHCSVRPTSLGFEVTDFSSRNGTFFGGAAVTKATVPVGAVLRVGSTLLQLMPAEQAIELPPSAESSFGGLFGRSLSMRRVYSLLSRASSSNASVLLLGESGTGKEVCARAIHEHSPRKEGPFVVFDCGAASENLLESDLFGHVKGAFTGADRTRPGAFARAHGGTLFLDEIGDLPIRLQPKLLRMLEAGETTPLGATKPERHDVRIVAATHRHLLEEVVRGGFRSDLYYRLAVVEVHLPPLRDRLEDIPELARVFLHKEGRPEAELGPRSITRMTSYGWPGNVRELRNVIARGVALSTPETPADEMPLILATAFVDSDTRPMPLADRPFHDAKASVVDSFEHDYLRNLVSRYGDNLTHAARVAGIERRHLYRLLSKHGLGAAPDDEA